MASSRFPFLMDIAPEETADQRRMMPDDTLSAEEQALVQNMTKPNSSPAATPPIKEEKSPFAFSSKEPAQIEKPDNEETSSQRPTLKDLEMSLSPEDLRKAQAQRKSDLEDLMIKRSSDSSLKRMAEAQGGTFTPDESMYKFKQELAGLPVQEVDEIDKKGATDRKAQEDTLTLATNKEAADPNSAISKEYRDFASKVFGREFDESTSARQLAVLEPIMKLEQQRREALARKSDKKTLAEEIEEFEAKEAIKDKVANKKENREIRKELDKGISGLESQLRTLENAKAAYKNYINSGNRTGPAATLMGGLKYASPETQKLDAAFKALNLETMSKLFQGMSKAVDSNAERAAFEQAQPSITNFPETNEDLFNQKIAATKALIEKSRMAKDNYDRTGSFTVEGPGPVNIPNKTNTNEVERRTKDGKTAIFDAQTKQFLRYKE